MAETPLVEDTFRSSLDNLAEEDNTNPDTEGQLAGDKDAVNSDPKTSENTSTISKLTTAPPEEQEPDEDGLTVEEFNSDQITDPTLPEGGVLNPITQVPNEEELLSEKGLQLTLLSLPHRGSAPQLQ